VQFVQVLLSLELYLLSPFMRRYIHAASTAAHLAVTALLVAAAAGLLLPLSAGLAASFLATVLAVSFIFPWQLVSLTRGKRKLNGPWDEAIPSLPASLSLPLPCPLPAN